MVFEKILEDSEIINIYNKINARENSENDWAHHDLNHVKNVSFMMNSLLQSLGFDEKFIDEAMVAGILHDTGCTMGKEGHPLRSYEFAKDYLRRKGIILENEELVLEAIKVHSDGFETDNIIALTLILSDKLDIKKTRVTEEGKKVIGMRQYQYIEDIKVKIEDGALIIDFIVDDKMDILEANEYYFTKKVFKAINAFSNKLNLINKVYINGSLWNIEGEK